MERLFKLARTLRGQPGVANISVCRLGTVRGSSKILWISQEGSKYQTPTEPSNACPKLTTAANDPAHVVALITLTIEARAKTHRIRRPHSNHNPDINPQNERTRTKADVLDPDQDP